MNSKKKFLFKVLLPKKHNYFYPLLDNGLSKEDLKAGIKVLSLGELQWEIKLNYLKRIFQKN